jgi:hypothetical protein
MDDTLRVVPATSSKTRMRLADFDALIATASRGG